MHIHQALLAADGDGAGGTGGGTGTGTEPPAKPFTDEQNAQMNQAITAGITRALGKFKTDIQTTIAESLKAFTPEIDATLDAKLKAFTDDKAKVGKGNGSAEPLDINDHPTVKGFQKQIAELNAKAKAAEEATSAEREKVRAGNLRTQLGEHLANVGVKDPARNKHAVTVLIAEGRAAWSKDTGEENTIVFNESDGPLDIKTGLAGWAKTDDAKIYIAPTTATGSGDRGGGKGPGAGSGKGYQRGQFGEALLQSVGSMPMIIGRPPTASGK